MSGATGLPKSRPGSPDRPFLVCSLARCSAGVRPPSPDVRETRSKASSSNDSVLPAAEPEPVVRSSRGHPVPFGPQNLHASRLRKQQAKEQARKQAERARKEADVEKAKQLLAVNKSHAKMSPQEKEARKQARRLLRAVTKHNSRRR